MLSYKLFHLGVIEEKKENLMASTPPNLGREEESEGEIVTILKNIDSQFYLNHNSVQTSLHNHKIQCSITVNQSKHNYLINAINV